MDARVYLGLWTNWSRGAVLGKTLTTTKGTGNLIIAFTAVFIGFVSSRFWRIASILLHRAYSTVTPQDAVHHQRQIILRNAGTPESGLLTALQVLWAWKRPRARPRRLLSLLPLVLLSGFCLASFSIAGGFSSNISTAVGDEVLLKGDHCGSVNSTISTNEDAGLIWRNNAEDLNNAANYAQQCYGSSGTLTVECNKFIISRLPTAIVNENASCPFDEKLCRSQHGNIQLDTGHLDSNDHLGLNAPQDRRFSLRFVLTCAPLQTEGYTSSFNENGTTWTRYHYGTGEIGGSDNHTYFNYAYEIEDSEKQYTFAHVAAFPGHNFRLSTLHSQTYQGAPLFHVDFLPIPELIRSDGDLSIIFLSGQGVIFTESLDDLWYRATTPSINYSSPAVSGTYQSYRPREPASPIGCIEQYQWCNSADGEEGSEACGPLASTIDAVYGVASKFNLTSADLDPPRPIPNSKSQATLTWNAMTLFQYPTQLNNLLGYLGAKSLASQALLFQGLQNPLPINQWQLDVQRWFEIVLSTIQAAFVNTALGPTSPQLEKMRQAPVNSMEQDICNNQKIRSSAHMSFSVLGLCITFVLGGFVIAVSLIIEPALSFFDRRWGRNQYARLEWSANSSLQLHRLAHEEFGLDKWSNCTKEVPLTRPDVLLPSLDISDLNHPILKSQSNFIVPDAQQRYQALGINEGEHENLDKTASEEMSAHGEEIATDSSCHEEPSQEPSPGPSNHEGNNTCIPGTEKTTMESK